MKSYLRFLGRNKLYTAIEILGLSVAIAVAVPLLSYLLRLNEVNHAHPDHENIYSLSVARMQCSSPNIGQLRKYGYVYWRQSYNFQTGDIIYIYVASPECCVKYKCLVEEHDLPFTENNLIDREFFVNPEDFEISKQYTRFMKLKLISTTNSNKLSLVHLLENGMKWAPQGSINLSNSVNAELLNYVESNF